MPVYNGGGRIREAIGSILSQSFGDFRLIISDNASDDTTERICREVCQLDRRVAYCRHRLDGVPFSAESPGSGDHPGVKVAVGGFRVEAGEQRGS
jgi:glycosyltransferase involved in cell wall biosynthesis